MCQFVYPNPKQALLALVRIFGPCPLHEIILEFRILIRNKQIEEIPYTWLACPKGFKRNDVKKGLEELWLAGER